MLRDPFNHALPGLVERLSKSIHDEPRLHRLGHGFLPNRQTVVACVDALTQLVFPGYFGRQGLTSETLPFHLGELVGDLMDALFEPVRYCLRYREGNGDCEQTNAKCDKEAERIVLAFLEELPNVREVLADDVQAYFDGDPAATSTDDVIFSYPGLYAVAVQRLAHVLYTMNVPLLPRIMTEHAHGRTGIDIHPGAKIGRRFMIDHGTGVVIGETCVIGNNVKVYQGVTLGALAPAYGQALRGTRRHPTIEDDVTIYAGATILGGDTVVGQGCTIGGNVFITRSVPPMNQVVAEPPSLKIRDRRPRRERAVDVDGMSNGWKDAERQQFPLDFQI